MAVCAPVRGELILRHATPHAPRSQRARCSALGCTPQPHITVYWRLSRDTDTQQKQTSCATSRRGTLADWHTQFYRTLQRGMPDATTSCTNAPHISTSIIDTTQAHVAWLCARPEPAIHVPVKRRARAPPHPSVAADSLLLVVSPKTLSLSLLSCSRQSVISKASPARIVVQAHASPYSPPPHPPNPAARPLAHSQWRSAPIAAVVGRGSIPAGP